MFSFFYVWYLSTYLYKSPDVGHFFCDYTAAYTVYYQVNITDWVLWHFSRYGKKYSKSKMQEWFQNENARYEDWYWWLDSLQWQRK
jgi:hypothetical protein